MKNKMLCKCADCGNMVPEDEWSGGVCNECRPELEKEAEKIFKNIKANNKEKYE